MEDKTEKQRNWEIYINCIIEIKKAGNFLGQLTNEGLEYTQERKELIEKNYKLMCKYCDCLEKVIKKLDFNKPEIYKYN